MSTHILILMNKFLRWVFIIGGCFWRGYRVTGSSDLPQSSTNPGGCLRLCQNDPNCHFFSFSLMEDQCFRPSGQLKLERDPKSAIGLPLCGRYVNSSTFIITANPSDNSVNGVPFDFLMDGSLESSITLTGQEIHIDMAENHYVDGVTILFKSGSSGFSLQYKSSSDEGSFRELAIKETRVSDLAITWIFKHPHSVRQLQIQSELSTNEIIEVIPHFSDLDLIPNVKDCSEMYRLGFHHSGSFLIDPSGERSPSKAVRVWCELGWTSILLRGKNGLTTDQKHYFDGTNDMREYQAIASDNNNESNEYWIGLENLYNIVGGTDHELIVNLWDLDGKWSQAHYQTFSIADSSLDYQLTLKDFQNSTGLSEAGDAFSDQNGSNFSLKANSPCNEKHMASGWLKEMSDLDGTCTRANIFGRNDQTSDFFEQQVFWRTFRGLGRYIPQVDMRLRPKNFKASDVLTDETELLKHHEEGRKGQFLSNFSYECDIGFEKSHSVSYFCQWNGTWKRDGSPDPFRCTVTHCKDPPMAPPGFEIDYWDKEPLPIDKALNYRCRNGMKLKDRTPGSSQQVPLK
ncbi:uncharacterized protein LOC131881134 [Tigriopus californicus]|uniref:uncharacterized protein LOC131881134 n=1 Tax=Tigriopus californicus TaxID=6832 RepID=UPI0027DA6E2D|nr:uncharacterized protein LOC131881134 [Tigriopus californicus]